MRDEAASILIVDDDRETQDLLREALEEVGYRVATSDSTEEALKTSGQECFDVILSHMRLGTKLNGLDVLKAYKAVQPDTEVILITAVGSMELAVEAVKAGAFDYLSKPFKIGDVLLQVRRALENRRLIRENRSLKQQLETQVQFSSLVGRSPRMLEVHKKIALAADSRSTLLIYGKTGTGKELVARTIHHNGPRAKRPFLAVHCGALTETWLEGELFGGVRGSFADAVESKRGIFEAASGGTVFLEEVSELSPALQAKLLGRLEEQEIRRAASVGIDVRIIAASARELSRLVEQGKFHQDLYDRLRGIEIELPPLRERIEDIPLLVEHFLNRFGRERGRRFSISARALSVLVAPSYPWPGNVRELENALESAAALSRSGVITAEDLPSKLRSESRDARRPEDFYADLPSLEELEKEYLAHVLKVTGDNKVRSAEILGIDRRTLYRLAERFKLPFGTSGQEK